MAGQLLPDVINRMLDNSGNPVSGGTATFYLTGTLDVTPIYSNAALSVVLANPISTNSGGLFVSGVTPTAIYFDPTVTYRAIYKDANGNVIRDIDPVNIGIEASSISFLQAGSGATIQTLQAKLRQYVSANDYFGVDPTGVADSTAGLKAAFDYVLPLGKGIELQGTYLVSGPISSTSTMSGGGMHIRCIGNVNINVSSGATAFRNLLYCMSSVPNSASITGGPLTIDMNNLGAEGIYIRHSSSTTGGVVEFTAPVTVLNCKQNDATEVNANSAIAIIGDYSVVTLNSPSVVNLTRTNTTGGACRGIFVSGFSGVVTLIAPYVEGVLTGNGSSGIDADGIALFGKNNASTSNVGGRAVVIAPLLVDNQGRSLKSQCPDVTVISPKVRRKMVVTIGSTSDFDFQRGNGIIIDPDFEYRLNSSTSPLSTGFHPITFQQNMTDGPMVSIVTNATIRTEVAMYGYVSTVHSGNETSSIEVNGLRVVPVGTFATAAFTRGLLEFNAAEVGVKTKKTTLSVRNVGGQMGGKGITFTGFDSANAAMVASIAANLSVEVDNYKNTLATSDFVFRSTAGSEILSVERFNFRACYGIKSFLPGAWVFTFASLVPGCEFGVDLATVVATNPPPWPTSGYAEIRAGIDNIGAGFRFAEVTIASATATCTKFTTGDGGTTWANGGPPTRTTAQIQDITNSINTSGKFTGARVWDSTTGLTMRANGATAGSTWFGAGSTLTPV